MLGKEHKTLKFGVTRAVVSTPIRTSDGTQLGIIVRCEHGSRFLQSKRVNPAHAVYLGDFHWPQRCGNPRARGKEVCYDDYA